MGTGEDRNVVALPTAPVEATAAAAVWELELLYLTKNCARFEEPGEEPDPARRRGFRPQVYLRQEAWRAMGSPDRVRVTIEPWQGP